MEISTTKNVTKIEILDLIIYRSMKKRKAQSRVEFTDWVRFSLGGHSERDHRSGETKREEIGRMCRSERERGSVG
ncbi:uncharacterized protein G2W53_004034 [Senna tora]|uniref:Uncharacterized protein n=1 Tax=Senna tora TaxID=362788 RepID=A0A835CG99_9FABA|nr:uncharacterized protein G2W53_004034 [Senna tora]